MNGKLLSHEEIWDDSELVTSWNEAVEEYKKYHSLAAKGITIDQALAETEYDQPPARDVQQGVYSTSTTLQASSTQNPNGKKETNATAFDATSMPSEQPATTATAPTSLQSLAVPQALLSTVQDESLKNIMMSWYYAGYYTGLYEGQQKAYAAMQHQAG